MTTQAGPTPKGLTIVFTGDGKGKTTATLGMVLRAWGHGLRVCVIQFIKRPTLRYGEVKAALRLGIEWHATGDGFVRRQRDVERAADKVLEGWQLSQAKIVSGEYDMIVLDEFTYVLTYGWLTAAEVVGWLQEHKPSGLHLVITGRGAPPELIDYADLVTEMRLVKHPFQLGIKGQKGVEF
jgi:cob(I)alamin adenosyltransferase